MEDNGYLIVWVIVEFKYFPALFFWTPPTHIKVAWVVAFLCMYLTSSLLFSYGTRYIPNINIASFALIYQSGTIYPILSVAYNIHPFGGFYPY